jgi:hypothetical protein
MDNSVIVQEKRLIRPSPLDMQRELLQIAAMLTMLIDHIGAVLFPDQWGWRMIGRISFPLYAFGIVQGYLHSSDVKRYIRRLGLLALASELPFILAFDEYRVNVIGTFFVGILALYGLDRIRLPLGRIAVVAAALAVLTVVPTDYGIYALLLLFIYRYAAAQTSILLHVVLNIGYWMSGGVWYQQLSALSTIWLAAGASVRLPVRPVPRWLWLIFYPVHLLLLFIVKRFFL